MTFRFAPLLRVLAALALIWAAPAHADPLARAETLAAAGRTGEVLRLLLPLAPADPQARMRRDFALATAHMQAGDTAAAVPLFDRLVSAAPQDTRFRLELARALIRAGDRDRARFHLMQARGSATLSAAERAALDRILAQIEGGKGYEAWARLAIVPESNPGQRTGADTVTIGGLEWTLNPASKAAPGTGLHLAAGGALLPRIGPGLRLRFGGSVDARLFRDKAINDVIVRGEFGLQGSGAVGGSWALYASVQDRRIGGAAYGRAAGLHASWSRLLGRTAQLRLRLDLEDWRFAAAPAQDGLRSGLSVAWAQALRPDLLLRGTVFANHIAARAGWEAGHGAGLSLGVLKAFEGGLMVGLDATLSHQRRDGPHPLFGTQRRDRRASLSARIMHRTVTVRGFAPVLELGIDRQHSTIPLHDFRNARLSLGFSREF